MLGSGQVKVPAMMLFLDLFFFVIVWVLPVSLSTKIAHFRTQPTVPAKSNNKAKHRGRDASSQ